MSEREYIDVNLLKEKLNNFIDMNQTYTDYNCGYDDCLTAVQDTISDIPIAEVKSIVHGEWIDQFVENNGVERVKRFCSLCECETPNKQYELPYCPYCGALMDNTDSSSLMNSF